MSESVTKKHSYKKDQIRYFTNWASTKKSLNNIENKQKNLKKLKSNLKPKKSLNEQGLSTSFDKITKTMEKKIIIRQLKKIIILNIFQKE